MNSSKTVLLIVLLAFAAVAVRAEDTGTPDSKQLAFFEARIRPLLTKHCYECHSHDSGLAENGLRLDSRDALKAGGDRGPALIPGDAEGSLLMQAMLHSDSDLTMPPNQERLSDTELSDMRRWIEMGAPHPSVDDAPTLSKPRQTSRNAWADQAPVAPPLPQVHDTAWPKVALDRFILAGLEAAELRPSASASPNVLLRRLHFDLVGLPPAPDAMGRFEQAIAQVGMDQALASEVDRLLESSAFGERWGRHWLDVARYAESSGKEANISFPYAWRYRDYVVDCFNADVPYTRFIQEQIAGDLLPSEGEAERARLLIATGFLAIGSKNLDEANEQQFTADLVDEQIDAVSRVFMASSIACARCHDHKFDPFSMEDYYALSGIFASTRTFFGTAVSPANRVGGDPLLLPHVDSVPILHESISKPTVVKLKKEHADLMAEKNAAGLTLRDALRILWRGGAIEGQLEKVDDEGRALPLGMGVSEAAVISPSPLLKRGEVGKPGELIARHMPFAIASQSDYSIPADQSGRMQLAQWLADDAHPLTSRVHVNRVWQHLFGSGLVATVDDFGSTGERPSHPQLLDFLALRFMEQGWSTKRLIRDIVLSQTYRQASTYREAAFASDPENRLRWRASKRRLEAECIRDAMLSAAGELDESRPVASLVGQLIGDRPISLIGLDRRLPKDLDGSRYRSLYLPVLRDRLPDVLDVFDFAEPSLVTGQRETTNVPTQALYLLNSAFVWERAAALADRLTRHSVDPAAQIELAFELCFGRSPTEDERARVLEFLELDAEAAVDSNSKLISFCQALLCTAEFRNLD